MNVTSPTNGVRVCVTAIRAAPTNAHFVAEADDGAADLTTQPFHPTLLQHLTGARLLRFDGWMKTEDPSAAGPRDVAQRPVPGEPQVHARGVAIEYMVMLCNQVQAAPWFVLPAAVDADDAWHAFAAAHVLAQLDAALPVYFEYAHGVLYNQWDKARATVVQGIWDGVFGDGGAADRLVHTHSTGYADHVTAHWGADLPQLDAVAIPAAVRGPFHSRSFVLQHPEYSVGAAVQDIRSAILDAEQEDNMVFQRARAAGVPTVMAYMAGVVVSAPRYGFRDDVSSAVQCQELRRYPCRVRVFNDTAGEVQDLYLANETHPVPYSAARLQHELDTATARLTGAFTNNWAARFRGQFVVAAKALHVFHVNVNYGMTLTIDGRELLHVTNPDSGSHAGSSGEVFVTLDAGSHALEVHYWDRWMHSQLELTVRVGDPAADPQPVTAAMFTDATIVGEYVHDLGRYLDSHPEELADDELLVSFARTEPSLVWETTLEPNGAVVAGAVARFSERIQAALDDGAFLQTTYDMDARAAAEQRIADVLHTAMDAAVIKDLTMDWWERLTRIGVRGVVTGPLYYPRGDYCPLPNSCATAGLLHSSGAAASPKLDAFVAYVVNGEQSNTPFTAADITPPAPATCDPACEWGSCGPDGTCHCFAGYSGAACDVLGDTPNMCARHGVNINGLADWSPQLTYTDVWRYSRGWTIQDFDSHEWSVDDGPAVPIDAATGYPTSLPANRMVGSMMIRDLDAHGVSGNCT